MGGGMSSITEIAPNLQRDGSGIWSAATAATVSYPQHGHQSCFELEEASFWFHHRNRCITTMVANHPPLDHGRIFDIGGGNGFVTKGLIEAGFDAVLVEPGPTGAANAKARGIPEVICATVADAGFRPNTLDAVGLFDVIEHIQDDRQFLEDLRGLMKPGGRLYATVPAYQALWSAEDVQAGHYRRYTRASIQSVLQEAGFRIDFSSYFFRPLPAPILLLRSLPHRLGIERSQQQAAAEHRPGLATRILEALLAPEVENLARNRPMAFGASCLLTASVA